MGIASVSQFRFQARSDKGLAIVMTLILSLLLIAGLDRPAMARPAFSAITVDASTGEIIYGKYIDARRYPASLTKVMTLYLMFQEIDSGRMSFSTDMKVSRHAAAQQPSKLGLKPGTTLSARDAMFALITKSANDAAMVVAEHIGGSQKAFAKRMTRQARDMGMTRTTFTNPNGLPDKRQVTTARDMATLGLRIQRDFPKYYKHFATRSYKYGNRNYRNHNRLLGKLEGVDGIKTGYTRASGFNLISSRTVGRRHVVAVVMGGRTGRSRNAFMIKILKRDTRKASLGGGKIADVAGSPPGYKASAAAAAVKATMKKKEASSIENPPIPRDKPDMGSADSDQLGQLALAYEHTIPVADPVANSPAKTVAPTVSPKTVTTQSASGVTFKSVVVLSTPAKSDSLVVADALGNQAASGAPMKDQSRILPVPVQASSVSSAPKAVAAVHGGQTVDIKSATPPHRASWNIQIGAFPTAEGARSRLDAATTSQVSELKQATPFLMTVDKNGNTLYRARFSGLNRKQATQACRQLKRAGVGCFPLAPAS
jgi:D-alanyl-D-alanine carboxypeptidase